MPNRLPNILRTIAVSDPGKSYDAKELDLLLKQKCLAHLIRNVTDVVESKHGRARQFGATLNLLLREGLVLWHAPRSESGRLPNWLPGT